MEDDSFNQSVPVLFHTAKETLVISTKWLTGKQNLLCCCYYSKINLSPKWLTTAPQAFLCRTSSPGCLARAEAAPLVA